MAYDIQSDIGTGTPQEVLDLTWATIVKVTAFGETRGINGRTITFSDLPSLYASVRELESKIAATTTGGSTTNYAIFKRAR